MWDAEHASQNVGLSHNVLARTTRHGDETVVEAITKVQSIDLVADPATTRGLFEQETRTTPEDGADRESPAVPWDDLTIDELAASPPRPASRTASRRMRLQLEQVQNQLDQAAAREADVASDASGSSNCSRNTTCRCPTAARKRLVSIVSDQFVETLLGAARR